MSLAADYGHLDHTPFARLLPSQRKSLLEEAVRDEFPFEAQLVTFFTSPVTDRTYAVLEIDPHGRCEHATFLVAFDHSRGGKPHFENGHYGFYGYRANVEATNDMYNRGNR